VEDSNTNPIMADDLIASRLWNPGTSLHYALVGRMDINGDGRDDRAQVRSLLQQFGGVIDAEDNPNGSVTGDVNIHTRYLVVGERPTESADARQLKAFSQLIDAATRNNVEQISIDKLVDAMGLGSRVRGAGATAWAQSNTPPASRTGTGGSGATAPGPDGGPPAPPIPGGGAAATEEPAGDLDFREPAEESADDLPLDEEPAGDFDAEDPFADPSAAAGSTSRRTTVRRERW
jgi:hypothetical protein